MKELLLAELKSEQIDLVKAVCLIEQHLWSTDPSESQANIEVIASFIASAQDALRDIGDPLEKAERLLQLIFIDQLFVSEYKPTWSVSEHQLQYAIAHRSIAPVVKNMLILHVCRQLGFRAEAVYVPDSVMVRIICDDNYAIIFDCIDGNPITWQELERRLGQDNEEHVSLQPINDDKLFIQYLLSLKGALIREQYYQHALLTTDLVLALAPSDANCQREHSFLLEQVDYHKVAFDDHQYFSDKSTNQTQWLTESMYTVLERDCKVH
ncbi:transglutaminase family protein [Thalassotalea ponticola]|uniref:transglutaminase family protein n=1 Tax=Thalassotalea ponticola TaxID=1523392 RepID=UPI0025B4DB53|nr:transglutaminase family protein [Thalassotalea ponticola]MDN3652535.1 transglutaminase family protein [Thalassotalea ponticola]